MVARHSKRHFKCLQHFKFPHCVSMWWGATLFASQRVARWSSWVKLFLYCSNPMLGAEKAQVLQVLGPSHIQTSCLYRRRSCIYISLQPEDLWDVLHLFAFGSIATSHSSWKEKGVEENGWAWTQGPICSHAVPHTWKNLEGIHLHTECHAPFSLNCPAGNDAMPHANSKNCSHHRCVNRCITLIDPFFMRRMGMMLRAPLLNFDVGQWQ